MKNIERHRLNNNWYYAQQLWSTKAKRYRLKGWVLKLSHGRSYIGLCDHNYKTIYLSSYFMRGSSCNYAKVKKSLMHEIAHVLTPGQSHNNIWKNKCKRLGGDIRKAGTMDLAGMNWVIYCSFCKWRQETFNKPKKGMICSKCVKPPSVKKII